MFVGLYQLLVSLVVAALVYYVGTIIPNAIVQKLAMVVAIIIAVLGLFAFLRIILGV